MNLQLNDYVMNITVVRLSERIDAVTAPALRRQLEDKLEAGARNFVLDLSEVPFMDSAALAVMVSLLKRARQADGDVKMVAPKLEAARRILELTKFDRVFDMKETPEEAVQSF